MRGVVYLGLGLSVLHSLWSLLVLSSTPNLRVAEHNWVKSQSSRLAELEGELGRSEVAVLDRGRALGKQLSQHARCGERPTCRSTRSSNLRQRQA